MSATVVSVGTGSGGIGSTLVQVKIRQSSGMAGDARPDSPVYSNANSPCGGGSGVVALSSGANTITVPATAAGILVVLPPTNAQTVTLKGVSGDTGIEINPIGFIALSFDSSPPASIVLTAGGAISGVFIYFF